MHQLCYIDKAKTERKIKEIRLRSIKFSKLHKIHMLNLGSKTWKDCFSSGSIFFWEFCAQHVWSSAVLHLSKRTSTPQIAWCLKWLWAEEKKALACNTEVLSSIRCSMCTEKVNAALWPQWAQLGSEDKMQQKWNTFLRHSHYIPLLPSAPQEPGICSGDGDVGRAAIAKEHFYVGNCVGLNVLMADMEAE